MSIDRAVVTLSPQATAAVRRMAAQMTPSGSSKPPGPIEVVRRGLILLDLHLSLGNNEELVIRNKDTGECDRLRLGWEIANSNE